VVNARDADAREQVRDLTQGGVDFALEFAGSIPALELSYAITRRGGTTVTASLPPSTAALSLPAISLVAEERTFKGSYVGSCVPSRDIPRYIDLYMQDRLPVNKLLTGRLSLERINEGFDELREGRAIRQVVVFP
jgi:alcohol dehydrogenase